MLWILDHASEGHGYGFPLDHRYLSFYERLQAAYVLIAKLKPYYPVTTANDAILWKLDHVIDKIVSDRTLHHTVVQYKTQLTVFSNLRRAMGAAPEPANSGLRQITVTASHQELQKIKTAVEAFMRALERQIQSTTAQSLRDNLIKVKERITEYGGRLFADPIVVEVNGEKRYFLSTVPTTSWSNTFVNSTTAAGESTVIGRCVGTWKTSRNKCPWLKTS
jgi:hypothetical protein